MSPHWVTSCESVDERRGEEEEDGVMLISDLPLVSPGVCHVISPQCTLSYQIARTPQLSQPQLTGPPLCSLGKV